MQYYAPVANLGEGRRRGAGPSLAVNDPAGDGVDARIGDLAAPFVELGVEIVETAEGSVEEEVLADTTERALDLRLQRRLARFRHAAEIHDLPPSALRVMERHRAAGRLAPEGREHEAVEKPLVWLLMIPDIVFGIGKATRC